MSFKRYIELLQALITMTDPDNWEEVLCAQNILKNLVELARQSSKADGKTLSAMNLGYHEFLLLLRRRNEFAGKPGEVNTNRAKRQRLSALLYPGC